MIIDASAWCGHWPFSALKYSDVDDLLHLMDRARIDRAVVSSLSAVFERDCGAANRRFARDLAAHADRLSLAAIVNPVFPGCKRDIEEAADELDARAIRLVPNYHGYDVADGVACSAVCAAADRRLPVYITFRLQDERSHPPAFRVPPVSPESVNALAERARDAILIASFARLAEIERLNHNVDVEISGVQGPSGCLARLLERSCGRRVLFGSGAILQIPECGVAKLHHHRVPAEGLSAVAQGFALTVLYSRC